MCLQHAFVHRLPMRFLPFLLNPLGCHWIQYVLRPFRPCPGTPTTNQQQHDTTVGAPNMDMLHRQSGNRQSRMRDVRDDGTTEGVEDHQLRTAQDTCLNREDRRR